MAGKKRKVMVENVAEDVYEVRCGDILIGVNLRYDKCRIYPKMNEAALPSLDSMQACDLQAAMSEALKLTRGMNEKEKQKQK